MATALAGHWPAAEGSTRAVEARQARLMNTVPKIVLSRSRLDLPWGPASRVGDDLVEEVAKLKALPGKDLALFAGASAISAFVERDLVDEYRLIVYPVVLGEGQPLFAAPHRRRALKLADTRRFDESGVVILRYLPAQLAHVEVRRGTSAALGASSSVLHVVELQLPASAPSGLSVFKTTQPLVDHR